MRLVWRQENQDRDNPQALYVFELMPGKAEAAQPHPRWPIRSAAGTPQLKLTPSTHRINKPVTLFRHNEGMRWGRWLGLWSLCALLSVGSRAWAGAGPQAAEFLTIPVGGRPAALGGAYSALANDPYAPTYNPGALGFLTATEISGHHLAYLESIHYEYLSAVHPLNAEKTSAIGVAAQYLGSGDITAADANGNTTGSFNTHYGAYAVAYGHRLGEKLGLGVSAKLIQADIADVGAHAVAGDIGALYQATDRVSLALHRGQFWSKADVLRRWRRAAIGRAFRCGLAAHRVAASQHGRQLTNPTG